MFIDPRKKKKIFTVFVSLSNTFRSVPALAIRKAYDHNYLCFMLHTFITDFPERAL